MDESKVASNNGLVKVAVRCSADTFVVNQSWVHRRYICGKNRHLRLARERYLQCEQQNEINSYKLIIYIS